MLKEWQKLNRDGDRQGKPVDSLCLADTLLPIWVQTPMFQSIANSSESYCQVIAQICVCNLSILKYQIKFVGHSADKTETLVTSPRIASLQPLVCLPGMCPFSEPLAGSMAGSYQ